MTGPVQVVPVMSSQGTDTVRGTGLKRAPLPLPPREVFVRFEQMGAGELKQKDVCGEIRQLLAWQGHRQGREP